GVLRHDRRHGIRAGVHPALLRGVSFARPVAQARPLPADRGTARVAASFVRTGKMPLSRILTITSALALAACATGPDYVQPETRAAVAGPFVSAVAPAVQGIAPARDNWWRLYEDPVLDQLVADA